MAVEGNLNDLSLPTIIHSLIQEGHPSHIALKDGEKTADVYVAEGRVCHVALQDAFGSNVDRDSESLLYEILEWPGGRFVVESKVTPPTYSIEHSWDYLLMEWLRSIDEARDVVETTPDPTDDDFPDFASEDHEAAAEAVLAELEALEEEQNKRSQEDDMASKSEQLQSILSNLVESSTDILGAAVVSTDGLLMASAMSGPIDGNRTAAVSAGLISLSNRSVQQLNQGEMSQILIRATQGNIIAMRATDRASFVALTPTTVNLGMAFIECEDAASEIADIL